MSYLFVEVRETSGKAVAGATLTLSRTDGTPVVKQETNADGVVNTRFNSRYEHHYNVQVSAPGRAPYEEVLFPSSPYEKFTNIVVGLPGEAAKVAAPVTQMPIQVLPIRIVLLAAPSTDAGRESFTAEERRRRLLLAAKRGDAADVRELLGAGVGPDTSDAAGVPAVAWAALAGDDATIMLLLDAGADVSKKSLARQSLLIYLADGIVRRSRTGAAPPQGRTPLEMHEEVVRRLLAAAVDVNARDPDRGTVLNRALEHVPLSLSVTTLRALLAAGADANAPDQRGQTPLMLAVRSYPYENHSPAEVYEMLLAAGAKASVNAKDSAGRTALMHAVWSGYPTALNFAKSLIAAGARVNEADAEGKTALMLAARSNSAELIRTLFDAGARTSVNAKDGEGQTALIHAVIAYGGEPPPPAPETLKLLLDAGARINDADGKGRTSLMYAAEMYRDLKLGLLKALIAAGADVNVADAEGQTALMLAAKTNSPATVRALLEAGAKSSVNAKDRKGNSALLYNAAEYWATESAAPLVAAGADVNDTDATGQTPLMWAARRNSEETIKLLLGSGARINTRDKEGKTALAHAASFHSEPRVAQALLAAGADVNLADVEGQTPLIIAAYSNEEIVKLLLDAGALVNARAKGGRTALFSAVYKGPDAVRRLIAAGADVNAADEMGRTALMQVPGSYSYSSTEMLKVFTSAGADVNVADKKGETVLMWTTRIDSSAELLKALLEAGADVNAKNQAGQTALMYAIEGLEHVRAEKVRVLLAAGADPRAGDKQGQTPLSLARKAGDAAVVKLLEEAEARR
jgi:ankyrin repeat protein